MNDVYSNARDRVGKTIADYAAEHMNPGGVVGIDWCSAHDIDPLAEKILDNLWGGQGASANMPLIYAQFTTGADRGITGFQPVDVLKVEAQDDGALTVTLNYWPKPDVIMPTFERAWADCEVQGFRYGPDALEQVKLGWDLAIGYAKWPTKPKVPKTLEALMLKVTKQLAEQGDDLVMAWLAKTGIDPRNAMIVQQMTDKGMHIWIEQKPIVPDFEALGEKRMSEMTPAEQDDAKEGWLRNNVRYFDQPVGGADPTNHIEFLLARIDQLRGVK